MAQEGTNEISGPQLVILSNSNSTDYFKRIQHELAKKLQESEEYGELESVQNANDREVRYRTLSSQQELDHFLANISKAGPFFFLITVELYWDNTAYQGYKVVLEDLIKHEVLQEELHLHFTSFMSRQDLSERCKDRRYMLVKCFPQHFQLPYKRVTLPEEEEDSEESEVLMDNTDNLLELKPMLPDKWKWLRKRVLNKSGILADLAHRLQGGVYEKDAKEIINKIKSIPKIAGKEILDYVYDNDAKDLVADPSDLRDLLENRDIVQEDAKTDEDETDFNFKLLVVEDENTFIEKHKKNFAKKFDLVIRSSGVEAMQYIKDNGSDIKAVICDLELLDEHNLHQDTHGIDVINLIKKKYPHIVLKIITGLSRRAVGELLSSLNANYRRSINVSDVIYKHNVDPDTKYNSTYIKELKSTIEDEILYENNEKRGPDSVLWSSTEGKDPGCARQYYYRIKETRPKYFEEMWQEIDGYVNRVIAERQKINFEFGKTRKIKEIIRRDNSESEQLLKTLLINRLFWHKLYYRENSSTIINMKKFHNKYFGEKHMYIDGKYFSPLDIGCSNEPRDNAKKVTLNFRGLDKIFEREEKLWRKYRKAARENFDYTDSNSHIAKKIGEIIRLIHNKRGQGFNLGNYPSKDNFKELQQSKKLDKEDLKKVLKNLRSEESTDESIIEARTWKIRKEVIEVLKELNDREDKNKDEYDFYDSETKELLNAAIKNLNWSKA